MLSPESEDSPFLFEEPRVDEPIARTPQGTAPSVSNDAAPVRESDIGAVSAAAMWHARADALRAVTDTVPSAITRDLMPKIIALYDSFARAEGWSDKQLEQRERAAPKTPPAEESPVAEFADEFPEDDAPPSPAAPEPAWLALARRPLPSSRRRSTRR